MNGRRLPVVRAALTLGVVAGVLAVPAAPAAAHARLLHGHPAAGTVVRRPVSAVVLTFTEAVEAGRSTVVVTGPGRTAFGRGGAQVADSHLTQEVYPLRSGVYRVSWRVISADGHAVRGSYHFTVSLPPSLEPTVVPPRLKPAATAAKRSDSDSWTWIGLEAFAAVLLLLGAAGWRRGARPAGNPHVRPVGSDVDRADRQPPT